MRLKKTRYLVNINNLKPCLYSSGDFDQKPLFNFQRFKHVQVKHDDPMRMYDDVIVF